MNDQVNLNTTLVQPKLNSPLNNQYHHPDESMVNIINYALGNLGVVGSGDSFNGLREILDNPTPEPPSRNFTSVDDKFS